MNPESQSDGTAALQSNQKHTLKMIDSLPAIRDTMHP